MKKILATFIIVAVLAIIIIAIVSSLSEPEKPVDTSNLPDNVKIIYSDQIGR